VLHPSAAAGARCTVEHVDGTVEHATLPERIVAEQPVAPFAEMRALRHQAAPHVQAELRFDGDIFEMEDQRNWTDASYKTFCTPLRLPYPVEIPAGSRIRQAVTLIPHLEPAAGLAPTATETRGQLRFTWSSDRTPVPALGLGTATDGPALEASEIERLGALRLSHLRVDLPLAGGDAGRLLQQASGAAQALGAKLEVGLLLPDEPDDALGKLAAELRRMEPPVATWLVYPALESLARRPPLPELIAPARRHLAALAPGAAFAAGTNSDFIFFNRYPPPFELLDRVTFAINPQVHTFDNTSLMETLPMQALVVENARRMARKPVIVSPVTLKPRFNPYAGAQAVAPLPGALPASVDPRQMSLFAAAWTVGSLASLMASGVAGATYFETAGWRGVLERRSGSPMPELFRSLPGSVFPLYHVLADAGEFRDGEVLASASSDPRTLAGFVLHKQGRLRVVLANLSEQPLEVRVEGVGRQARLRTMDETSALRAMLEPEAFRAEQDTVSADAGGALQLRLLPYAVARIDMSGSVSGAVMT